MITISLSKETKSLLASARSFLSKTGKNRIAINSKDYRRLCNEYERIKIPMDGVLKVNEIEFYDGGNI